MSARFQSHLKICLTHILSFVWPCIPLLTKCLYKCLQSYLQGVEQSLANLMYFALAQKLYPSSGYQAETGGYLHNLRTSTSIAKVREYHKKFYRPENLCVTITGRIDEGELFETLKTTEEKVLSKREVLPPDDYQRPWQTPLEKIHLDEDLFFKLNILVMMKLHVVSSLIM